MNFFCYPAGSFDGETIAAVREAGYLGATTTEPGLASRVSPTSFIASVWSPAMGRRS